MAFSVLGVKTKFDTTGQVSFTTDFFFPVGTIENTDGSRNISLAMFDDLGAVVDLTTGIYKLEFDVDYEFDESSGLKLNFKLVPSPPVGQYDWFALGLPLDWEFYIIRDTKPSQETNLLPGVFPEAAVETIDDKSMMVSEENRDTLSRALLNPVNAGSGGGPPVVNLQDIIDNTTNIAANLLLILANTGNITSNDAEILALQLQQATNIAGIATNLGNITSNDGDILALQAALGALGGGEIVQNRTIAGVFPTAAQDFNIVTIAGVTLTLPALPIIGTSIKVKQDNLAGTILNASHNIDGFGLTYTLLSNYESVFLVFNGTQWYIN